MGLRISRRCSICGEDYGRCEHQLGESYGGVRCHVDLVDPVDAYEWSFVVIPAQRGAGVTKSHEAALQAVDLLMETSDLPADRTASLIEHLRQSMQTQSERAKRAAIAEENKQYLQNRKERCTS